LFHTYPYNLLLFKGCSERERGKRGVLISSETGNTKREKERVKIRSPSLKGGDCSRKKKKKKGGNYLLHKRGKRPL